MNFPYRPLERSPDGMPVSDTGTPAGADVLIVSGYYHPEPTGSAPPISDLSFWLAEQEAAARVLTVRPSYPLTQVHGGYRNGERDVDQVRGVEVQRLAAYVSPSRGMIGRLRCELSMFSRMAAARLSGRVQPSRHVIAVCPSVFVVAVAGLFRRRDGRLLCIVHDIQSGLGRSLGFASAAGAVLGVLRALERWSFNRCDVLVALSEDMAEELRDLGVRRPIVILPPQIDVRELRPSPEPQGEAPILLYSGNLGRKQGLDQVLALAAVLARRGTKARIVIRGQGSEREELERKAAADGLANVTFQDLARREEISEAFAEGAIHLVPQNPDGASFAVPSKVFSIMAARRPFLATARPGTPLARIATESGAGACVEPYDSEALADAAEALLADARRRDQMGARGRAYVEANVDREVVCREIWKAVRGD